MLVCLLAPTIGAAASASAPLVVRNLAPVGLLYGIPGMVGAGHCCTTTETSFRIAQASHFTAGSADGVVVFFDGETTAAEYQFRGALGERFEWGVVVPLMMHSGGFLDQTIDGFHELFDLPDGGRDLAGSDRLDYLVRVDGETFVRFSEDQRGFGDLRGWIGFTLQDTVERAVTVRGGLKLPSGRTPRLTGSEAVDASLWLEWSERALLQRLGIVMNGGLGVSLLGDGELSPRTQESWSAFWHFGLARSFGERLTLIGQLDGHSRVHDGPLVAFGGRALQGTLGARYAVTPSFDFELGLVEDLKTRSAADVIFQLQLNARL